MIIADTHVHFYDCYDMAPALRTLAGNLGRWGGSGDVMAAFLTEREGGGWFRGLRRRMSFPGAEDVWVQPSAEPECLMLAQEGLPELWVFAGRQIVAAEGIEILALTVDLDLRDGLPAREVVDTILRAGGVPVLSWAPGKWWFRRGRVIEEQMASSTPGRLSIGDTTLRPRGCPEPLLMSQARKQGFTVLAGSDPLPFPGEEARMGTYVSVLEGVFEPIRPVSSVRHLLAQPNAAASAGRRGAFVDVAGRLIRNEWARRTRAAR